MEKKTQVSFSQGDATRIARVVRAVERSPRDSKGLVLGYRPEEGGGGGTVVKIGVFTGGWPAGATKTVRLGIKNSDEGETVTAKNLFCATGESCGGERWCAVMEEGGDWFLLAAECGGN